MTRPRAVIVVATFAVLFAAIAAWLTYGYLQQEMTSVRAVQPQQIVVAASDIPIGSAINASQVRETSWPKESIPQGSYQQAPVLVGRIAIRSITKGDAVTEAKLKPKAGAPGSGFMTYVVPQGHRAVTVAVNEVAGVAGFLTPNDRVDVVLTTALPGSEKENISKIILENIPVLATGQITDQKEGKPAVVPTVTLDLSPSDAEKLVLSASKGSLQMLLRNITDSAPVDSKGATISQVLSGVPRPVTKPPAPTRAAKAVYRPAAPRAYTLDIIRGIEKTSRQYSE